MNIIQSIHRHKVLDLLKNNQKPIILTNHQHCTDKEINTIAALSLSGALYDWMIIGHKGSAEELAALPIAKEANQIAFSLRETQFYSTSKTQTQKVKQIFEQITPVWNPKGEPFQAYINFTIAIIEDVLTHEKNCKLVTNKLNELLDLMAAMLAQFDPDYEDIEAAETAERAFKVWKMNKFF